MKHWGAVEALAEALVEHRFVEGERVARIIDRALSEMMRPAS
jgi:hypothetical protein